MPNVNPASDSSARVLGGDFQTTQWTVVLRAAQTGSPISQEALAKLCKGYWYPLYVYIRRRGHGAVEAEDLTQEFFRRLLEKGYLGGVERGKGRFRSFLLTALKHFLANEWDRSQTQKRGGGQEIISLDVQDAEGRYDIEPADRRNPEVLFDQRWALTLMERVLQRLKEEQEASGRGEVFSRLQGHLAGSERVESYAAAGAAMGMSEGAVRVAAHRLRQRYGEILRDEIGQTVETREEIEEEIRYLISVLSQ
jgi:RNA polymerase sigma factor (sigma-70 family)